MFRSFYTKLSLLFLVLMISLGLAIAVLSARSFADFADETEQKLNRSLASELAARLEPTLEDGIPDEVVEAELRDIRRVNPRVEVYLLDPEGALMARYLLDGDTEVVRGTVDLGPVRRFIAGNDPPILGDDPTHAERAKPFSAATIRIMGKPNCFVYVILSGSDYDSVAEMVRGSYILKATARGVGLSLLLAGIVGLGLFGLLTRRLRAITEVVSRFAQGHFDERTKDTSSDELGQLASSFNAMADTIASNVAELQRVDRQRRELVANVSHDLRSPLSSMQGYLETIVMKDETLTAEDRARYLQVVLRNTESLNMLVAELFELSMLDAEQVMFKPEPFSVSELAHDVVQQFAPEAERSGVRLITDHGGALNLVFADIALVERVLSNLIDNAIRFTPDGGIVRVESRGVNGEVVVEVADTGAGIPAEDLPHVFDRFYKVDKSRTRSRGGAGLGLAIANKIVGLHGGRLKVESAEGKGTTFGFSLRAWRDGDTSPETA